MNSMTIAQQHIEREIKRNESEIEAEIDQEELAEMRWELEDER